MNKKIQFRHEQNLCCLSKKIRNEKQFVRYICFSNRGNFFTLKENVQNISFRKIAIMASVINALPNKSFVKRVSSDVNLFRILSCFCCRCSNLTFQGRLFQASATEVALPPNLSPSGGLCHTESCCSHQSTYLPTGVCPMKFIQMQVYM